MRIIPAFSFPYDGSASLRYVSFDHALLDLELLAYFLRLIIARATGMFLGVTSKRRLSRDVRPDPARQCRGHGADAVGNYLFDKIYWRSVVTAVMPDLIEVDSAEHLSPLRVFHHRFPCAPLRVTRK